MASTNKPDSDYVRRRLLGACIDALHLLEAAVDSGRMADVKRAAQILTSAIDLAQGGAEEDTCDLAGL